ncbi:MAG: SseB family protein [Silvanigrellaceae bacterium]
MVLKKLFGKRDSDSEQSKTNSVPESTEKPGASAAPEAGETEQQAGEPKAAEYLELAMVENARQDTADSRRKVYQELLFSELLLALAEPDPNAAPPAPGEDAQNMSVAILQNSAGTPFAAAFTSGAAARRWRPDGGQYVSVKGQDIFKLLEPSPAEVIVVNAGSAPFIILPKVEYRQLAMGIVPQSAQSPVQVASGQPGQEGQAAEASDGQMQVAFPPDVFSDEQKEVVKNLLTSSANVEAAVLGAILPPNAAQDAWIRTIFLRVSGVHESGEAMQNFCTAIKGGILENQSALFEKAPFEVGVMPDVGFWQAMHQNGIILFDKNPPPMSQPESKDGVVDARLEA